MLLGKSKRAHEMVQCSEAGSVAKGPKKIPTKVTWGRVVQALGPLSKVTTLHYSVGGWVGSVLHTTPSTRYGIG